jgi:hypothetical protein
VFAHGKPFQDSIVFASKAGAYPSETPFRCSTLGQTPGLAHKQYTMLKRPYRDKHITWTFVNYGCKSLITVGLGANVIKPFLSVIYEFSY